MGPEGVAAAGVTAVTPLVTTAGTDLDSIDFIPLSTPMGPQTPRVFGAGTGWLDGASGWIADASWIADAGWIGATGTWARSIRIL
jgi:hypothetical protein